MGSGHEEWPGHEERDPNPVPWVIGVLIVVAIVAGRSISGPDSLERRVPWAGRFPGAWYLSRPLEAFFLQDNPGGGMIAGIGLAAHPRSTPASISRGASTGLNSR